MSCKGIRISDKKENQCISLSELLKDIPNGDQFCWALLWFDVAPKEKEGRRLTELQKSVEKSGEGVSLNFEALIELSSKIFQEVDVLIVGCKNSANIHRYESDREMYETCDIVMEMKDNSFWEVFSKNTDWIDWLAKKYQKVKSLSSDFQDKDH